MPAGLNQLSGGHRLRLLTALTGCAPPALAEGPLPKRDGGCPDLRGACAPAHSALLSLSEYSAEQAQQQVFQQPTFMASTSAHPFRDLALGWEQHRKLLPGVASIQVNKVAGWTVDEVRRT